ncbi:MAG TPA: hypothetical protein DDZ89_21310 [Clostridiales bacterium]|nr:hypothetical protein [Clostridiales bacterium]
MQAYHTVDGNSNIIQYHIVFIPKYRQRILYGQTRTDVREIIRKLCEYKKVDIGSSMQGSCSFMCQDIP